MAVTPFDSGLYRDLMVDTDIASLFTDSAEIRAMMLVEGALARAQGKLGIIPETSAAFIERSAREIQIDPSGLAAETRANGIPVPGLVKAMRKAMEAPEHAQYLHWGATSQDIMDTGLALRLRQVLGLLEQRLDGVLGQLAGLAETHATLPMAGRTWMQVATPTSFGAVAASWGLPLLAFRGQLGPVKDDVVKLSLSGAAGTLSVMGPDAQKLRAEMAQALKLSNPETSWHSARDGLARLSAWATQVAASCGRIGEDLLLMSQSGIEEVTLGAGGGSSTMPQKQNPVDPSLLSAIGQHVIGCNSVMQAAAMHRQQRDAANWMSEWMSLGQICTATGRSLQIAEALLDGLSPNPQGMLDNLDDGRGLIYAEALQFHLTDRMSRPEAQDAVKSLCRTVQESGGNLKDAAIAKWDDPQLATIFSAQVQLGLAPMDARNFVKRVRAKDA